VGILLFSGAENKRKEGHDWRFDFLRMNWSERKS